MALRPWNRVPIQPPPDQAQEPLLPLPPSLARIEPHPYRSLGAPYGAGACPFRLRRGVIQRLLAAQTALQRHQPQWCFAIFDAWRPLAVQAFMVEHSIAARCRELGVDPAVASAERLGVVAEVGRFWAPPNPDPLAPPPHSTGAAVDLTLAQRRPGHDLQLLDMGSAIDAIGAVSEPDHFLERARNGADAAERHQLLAVHGRRQCLREAMEGQGFAQHPHEWWHFSWGDQLWAWRQGQAHAVYGRVDCAA